MPARIGGLVFSACLALATQAFAKDATPVDAGSPKLLPLAQSGFAATPEAAHFYELCRTVRVEGGEQGALTKTDKIGLKDMELRLICGDQTSDRIGEPWAEIPPNEAAYFMRGFLQARGYHRPIFIQDGGILFVKIGPLSRLSLFRLSGGPEKWDPPRRRLVEGQPLTPTLLDDLQGWSLSQIKNEGYACATATSRADPVSGEALITFAPNGIRMVGQVVNAGDTGLRDGVLDRYNAFSRGGLYRERLIQLTKRRTQDDGFLQNLSLTPRCAAGLGLIDEPDEDGPAPSSPLATIDIVRDVVLGPAHTISIGVGGSTDEGARARAIVRRNRIGESASSAQARLNLSYLNETVNHQVADSNFRWYYAPGEARSFLEPQITFEHLANVSIENRSMEAKVLHGWTPETPDGHFELRAGPTFLDSHLSRGTGPNDVSATFAELNMRWLNHDFEFYNTSPRTGETVDATLLLTSKRWGANFTAQKLQVQGEKLWNLSYFDPPLAIIGLRFDVSSVFSPDNDITPDLPVRFLTFLGGDPDLRGFERSSLPRSGVGALSGATAGLETRFHKVIFRRADAFGFLDSGILGGAGFALKPPYLMSPGLGVRWESPIGVFRAYVAQRFALRESPDEPPYGRDNRLGFTYGEEF